MFGAFGAMGEHVFDDELSDSEQLFFEQEGIRYFSNVMTTFSVMAEKAIKKTKTLAPAIIAPGHGPIYRSDPGIIIDAYERYCKYANGAGKHEITILWGSMYGMTEQAVHHVTALLEKKGITVHLIHEPTETDSEMIAKVFQSAAIIIATPTYEYKMFPPVAHALDEIGRKRITGKQAFRFGSYGWSGGAEKELKKIIDDYRLNWTFTDSVEFNGAPGKEDLEKLEHGVMELIKAMESQIIQ
jgi:flavorubredoxin